MAASVVVGLLALQIFGNLITFLMDKLSGNHRESQFFKSFPVLYFAFKNLLNFKRYYVQIFCAITALYMHFLD